MRRWIVRTLIVLVLLVGAGAAGYVSFWYVAAGQMKSAIAEWAAETDASAQVRIGSIAMSGFPAKLIATADRIEVRHPQGRLPWAYSAENLRAARALTGGPTIINVLGPQTFSYTADGETQTVRAQADFLSLELREREEGGVGGLGLSIAGLRMERPGLQPLTARRITVQIGLGSGAGTLPARSRFTLRAENLTMPEHRRGALGDTIEILSFNTEIRQPILGWDLPVSLAQWRDADGYVVLSDVVLKWGTLDLISLSTGVLRIDKEFRPAGAMNTQLSNYLVTVDAFHAARKLSDEARAAVQAAIGFLSARGGPQRIGLPMEIHDGQIVIGPATLGTVKPILPGLRPPG